MLGLDVTGNIGMHFDEARHRGHAALALALVLSSNAAPALCEENTNPLGSVLGFFAGHADLDQGSIDYHPRAPLVVPPTRDLPEPKEAVRDPAWPKDSEKNTSRRRGLAARGTAPLSGSNGGAETQAKEAQNGQVEPAKPDSKGDCSIFAAGQENCLYGSWSAVQSAFGGAASDTVKPGVEPTRKLLTEPPAGYRTATIVPKTAEEKPKEQAEPTSGFSTFLKSLGIGKSSGN